MESAASSRRSSITSQKVGFSFNDFFDSATNFLPSLIKIYGHVNNFIQIFILIKIRIILLEKQLYLCKVKWFNLVLSKSKSTHKNLAQKVILFLGLIWQILENKIFSTPNGTSFKLMHIERFLLSKFFQTALSTFIADNFLAQNNFGPKDIFEFKIAFPFWTHMWIFLDEFILYHLKTKMEPFNFLWAQNFLTNSRFFFISSLKFPGKIPQCNSRK